MWNLPEHLGPALCMDLCAGYLDHGGKANTTLNSGSGRGQGQASAEHGRMEISVTALDVHSRGPVVVVSGRRGWRGSRGACCPAYGLGVGSLMF